MPRFTTTSLLLLAVFLSASAMAGDSAAVAPDPVDSKGSPNLQEAATFVPPASSWSLGAGYQWRDIGSVQFDTGSHFAQSALPWTAGHARSSSTSTVSSSSVPGTFGPDGIGNHTYNDGFVNEFPGTSGTGETWFWGYNNASQLQGNNLSYHASASTSTVTASTVTSGFSGQSSSLNGGQSANSDLSGSGWYANIESPALFSNGPFTLTAEIGYSFAGSGGSLYQGGVFQAHQETVERAVSSTASSTTTTDVTDVYNVGSIIVPTAPYVGTLAGPGALISDAPTSRLSTTSTVTTSLSGSRSTSVQTADFLSNVNESFHVNMNTVSLGPHFNWEWQRLQAGVATGLALNVADWSADDEETLLVSQNGGAAHVLSRWNGQSSGTTVLPGVYWEATAQVALTQHLSLFVSVRYDWARDLQAADSASSVNLDVHGWTVIGGFLFKF